MRFQKLDLNLLVTLDALLTEKSVSQAADRICLSQSATSSALARLREYFNDDLLTLKGRQMELTPRGAELLEPVRAVLEQIRTTIVTPSDFDPATSDRAVRIMASDYVTEVLLSRALLGLSRQAPHMTFEICPLGEDLYESLERRSVDLLTALNYAVSPDHPSTWLFADDYVVVGWAHSQRLADGVSLEQYFQLSHVTAKFGKSRLPAFEEWFMRSQSLTRRVEVAAPSFLSIPYFLMGSDRIATMHRRLAVHLAQYMPLKIMPLPFDMPPIGVALQWHKSNDRDPALRWVIAELTRVARGGDGLGDGADHPVDGAQPSPDFNEYFQASMSALRAVKRHGADGAGGTTRNPFPGIPQQKEAPL